MQATRDLKKLLGNPKIIFVLGMLFLISQLIVINNQFHNRWASFRQGNTMRKVGGRIWVYPYFNW